MTVKPLGKLLLLIVLVGLLAGGYRLYQSRSASGGAPPRRTGASNAPRRNDGGARRTSTPAGAGDDTAPDNTAPDNTAPAGSGGGSDGSAVEMVLLTSGSKNDWLAEQITKFNDANQGKYHITTRLRETREAFQAILNDKEKPVLWSPSSPIWANRLAEVWPQKHGDQQILDVGDDKTFGLFLRTPMVFLTTKAKARTLRPILEGAGGPWAALRDLSQGRRKMPSGSFRFAYADPVTSNSGFLTLGLILADYASRTGQAGALDRAANDPRFFAYLAEMHRGFVFDETIDKGTGAVTRAFATGALKCDLITTYESSALSAAEGNPNLAVIYPNPTAVAEQTVCALGAPYVSAEQRDGARAFLTFLGTREAQREGLKFYQRPIRSVGGALSLSSELSNHASQGFRESFASIELPGYSALNAAAYQWRIHVARRSASLR